jgi:hypothetical protein
MPRLSQHLSYFNRQVLVNLESHVGIAVGMATTRSRLSSAA